MTLQSLNPSILAAAILDNEAARYMPQMPPTTLVLPSIANQLSNRSASRPPSRSQSRALSGEQSQASLLSAIHHLTDTIASLAIDKTISGMPRQAYSFPVRVKTREVPHEEHEEQEPSLPPPVRFP